MKEKKTNKGSKYSKKALHLNNNKKKLNGNNK